MSLKLKHIQDWLELARQASWSATALAKLCGVSTNTLRRHFLQQMRKTPGTWLAEQRQHEAIELLRDGYTIITQFREVYPFKSTQITIPSAKIMLVEESDESINDTRWVPENNLASNWHLGRGNINFADGYTELELPSFGQDPTNSNPTL